MHHRALLMVAVLLGGCVALPERNTSLPLTRRAAEAEIERMRREPVPVVRPVVVLGGYHAVGLHGEMVASRLAGMTSRERPDFLAISYPFGTDLDRIAAEVVGKVEARWPSSDPERTVEVDVVGMSMGGIVARWAELPPGQRVRSGARPSDDSRVDAPAPGKRLRIARLFTLNSPHRGAAMAEGLTPDLAARDLRRGSALLTTLDAALPSARYELVCYAHLHDSMVGATRAAPPGSVPIWTTGTLTFSHLTPGDDPLILADIARRVRGEEPLLAPADPPPFD